MEDVLENLEEQFLILKSSMEDVLENFEQKFFKVLQYILHGRLRKLGCPLSSYNASLKTH